MIHLYCGEGKGKTTAAMGLALRMAGRGRGVVIAQFLKSSDSGERTALSRLAQVTLLPVPEEMKFTFAMTEVEHRQAAEQSQSLLTEAIRLAREPGCGLLVLDEVCSAITTGMLPLEDVLCALDIPDLEIVLTGRDPHPTLEARADYITCCQKIRHPFDRGLTARPGIEF